MRMILAILMLLPSLNAAVAQDLKPKIIGQKDLSTNQGQPITIQLTDLYIEEEEVKAPKGDKGDKGDKHHVNGRTMLYPDGYMLKISAGADYSVSGNTITPDPAFTGVLTAGVRVKNEKYSSNKFELKLTVVPVPTAAKNIPPVITGQFPLSTKKNTPITVSLSDLMVTDPDNAYPVGFILLISPGEHYTAAGNVVAPSRDYTGTITVKLTVNDGTSDSPPFDLKIGVVEAQNVSPQIVGQIPLSISVNQSVAIVRTQLNVVDPDNNYPEDFSLTVFPGEHYTLNNSTVSPESDFTGELAVKVTVNDGNSSSNVFEIKIMVVEGPNAKPVIVGQTELKMIQGENLEIKFQNLLVEDPDNVYPDDFTMMIDTGDHYTLSNNTIAAEEGYIGILDVKISVSDAHNWSDPFKLKIEVIPEGRLAIIGQTSLEMQEDSSLTLDLSHLLVADPDNLYPQGFSLHVNPGDNYDVSNATVKPHRDFFGKLTVPVSVSKGASASPVYFLLLMVTPVNDAPRLLNIETEPLVINRGGPLALSSSIEVIDPDDDHLLFAEIGIDPAGYEKGKEELNFDVSENIHGVFEPDSGTLFLFGRASLSEYQGVLRSVKYDFKDSADSPGPFGSKKVTFTVNDGKMNSLTSARAILFNTGPGIEIPTAFTPNNDFANDTWKITVNDFGDMSTRIRVYDRKGNLVFQSNGFQNEWDGQFNGSPLPAGVYFFTIEMHLPQKSINYKGTVSILR